MPSSALLIAETNFLNIFNTYNEQRIDSNPIGINALRSCRFNEPGAWPGYTPTTI